MAALRHLRHEMFCRAYIKHDGNASEAYREVYNPPKPENARTYAAIIFRRSPKVRARIQELREIMARRADITIEKILTDYQRALDLAKAQEKPADIVNAATAQAKLVGLLKDRQEIGAPGDFDNMDSVADILAAVEREAGPETALKLAEVMGLDKNNEQDLIDLEPASNAQN